jgi:hypothetical protein
MAEVKGVLLNGWTKYLHDRFSTEAIERAAATLSPADAALIKNRFLDGMWYPYDTMRALRHLARNLPNASDAGALELGAYLAQYSFTGIYHAVMTNDPVKLVQKLVCICQGADRCEFSFSW